MLEESEKAIRRSTRTCGVQAQRFPAYESAGVARVARDVGDSGTKNSRSCPAMTEVLAQSRRTVPVLRRTRPMLTPFGFDGNPPAKSKFKSALVRAPPISGPKV